MAKGKKPDYKVSAIVKNSDPDYKNNKVGGAWINDDGTIDLYFDAFVVINGGPNTLVRLWPAEKVNDG